MRPRNGKNNSIPTLSGFTLIEVLVVVAIIALLVSILVPSLKRARWVTKLTLCKAHLHDIGTSMHTYTVTYNGWFPPAPYIGSTLWQGVDNAAADDNLFVLWYAKLTPNTDIFTCPATDHQIRRPSRIERVKTSLGWRFDIYTDGSTTHVNDWERLGQYSGTNGHGTSYEYSVWHGRRGLMTKLDEFWHVKKYKRNEWNGGIYKMDWGSPPPSMKKLLEDADDADWMANLYGLGQIRKAGGHADPLANNFPNPWDNHGVQARNSLYADGHGETVRYNLVRK